MSGKGSRATHPDDAASSDLVEEFLVQDEDFRALVAGELTVRFETLALIENPDQRVLIYRGGRRKPGGAGPVIRLVRE
ncbi:hypothetical protein [Amycolatopsis sp. WGS_07]|uniref:hypothetical protein n=1 Tax=Amycolatopsis sp. WGS_07 TaxID=3076764 RepID=UPI0038736774